MKSFREFLMTEGNPLSRFSQLSRRGYHSVFISPERKNRSPAANKEAARSLEKDIHAAGYAFRKARGVWKGEDGEEGAERSYQIIARNPGTKAGAALRHFGRKLGKKYDQQSILHHDPRTNSGVAIQTTATSGHRVGERMTYGKSHFNVDNPYGETQFKRSAKLTYQ